MKKREKQKTKGGNGKWIFLFVVLVVIIGAMHVFAFLDLRALWLAIVNPIMILSMFLIIVFLMKEKKDYKWLGVIAIFVLIILLVLSWIFKVVDPKTPIPEYGAYLKIILGIVLLMISKSFEEIVS